MTQVPSSSPPQPVVPFCYRHPRRETYVRCTRCERPICPECMNAASVGHQCPECVAEGRRTQRRGVTVFGGTVAGTRGYVTMTLIAINVLVEILSLVSGGGGAAFGGGFGGLLGGGTPLLEWGAMVGRAAFADGTIGPYGVADGEYYRLVTSMFLHLGPLHLLMNMYALWILGRTLEAALGPVRFLVLYLVSGLGGSVAVYLLQPYPGGAGASGAIFGLFAALFVVLKRLRRDTSSIIPILVLNILFSLVPGISWAAHLGGFVTGGLVAAAMAYAPPRARVAVVSGTVAALLVLFTVAIIVQTHLIQAQGFTPA